MISTSHGPPHCWRLIVFESPPSMDYCTLCRRYNILNLHLKWPPMDFTHCWSLLHHSSLSLSISASHGLLQSLHITLYVMISTSHGLPHFRSWLCLNLHLPWTPVHSTELIFNLHLLCTSPIVDHYNIIHQYLFQSLPTMDYFQFSI